MKNLLKKFKNVLIVLGVFIAIMVVNGIIPRNSTDDSKLMPISVTGTLVIFICSIVLFIVLLLGLFFIAKSNKTKKQKEEYKGVLCAIVSIIVELLCVILTISSNIFGLYGLVTSLAFYGCMIAAFSSFDSITFETKDEEAKEEVQVTKEEVQVTKEEVQVTEEETPAPEEETQTLEESEETEETPAPEEAPAAKSQEPKEEKKEATKTANKKPATSRSKKVDYNKLTIPELKELAKQKGISGYSKLKKQELIDVLSKPKPRKKTTK